MFTQVVSDEADFDSVVAIFHQLLEYVLVEEFCVYSLLQNHSSTRILGYDLLMLFLKVVVGFVLELRSDRYRCFLNSHLSFECADTCGEAIDLL